MKVRLLHRDPSLYVKAQADQRKLAYRAHDPRIHPLEFAREYQRALVATKIDRIFAKPFVHAFSGHLDSIKCLARCHRNVSDFFSGSCDGEIRFWNLPKRTCLRSVVNAHEGFVEDMTVSIDDKYLFTCGQDRKVQQWAVEKYFNAKATTDGRAGDTGNLVADSEHYVNDALTKTVKPAATFLANSALRAIDHHDEKPIFITAGETVCLWDEQRSSAVNEFTWGNDSFCAIKWSRSEPSLFLAATMGGTVCLFDVRQGDGIQRVTLDMRSNACCWNPYKPFNFTLANEDSNLYTFDMRNFSKAFTIHSGFVNAALCVDYHPTGQELVAGSFDHTIRIWKEKEKRSREVYHNQRQQMVLSTMYTGDGKFVLSGSADMNIRLWKTEASEVLGPMNRKEKMAVNYRNKLKEKFGHFKEIRRIAVARKVPKYIKKRTEERVITTAKESRKEKNRVAHNPKLASHKPLVQSMIRAVDVEEKPGLSYKERMKLLRKKTARSDEES